MDSTTAQDVSKDKQNQTIQKAEGVLMMGRPHGTAQPASTAAGAAGAATSSLALPVKNNMILADNLAVLAEFRQQVEADLAASTKAELAKPGQP
mmetsp:Transcript_12414/g.26818  ORF Transcript_12414/g.26818 Transcript_12414/m.26818 type:complete len:94 (+) Transcript_12414:926-1207(+)|eukprot:CAMPEP_0202896772 /NCGR_PEP_ID=MMETSP1392-20130828/5699_1 /ASSEMBLY_ACC=CAM_ASM_000868 /TAXON_ID=225041 /ORGANISM="Chlamydomonas chlamydogama, Strain SAG 11-48b" /LENGTH=93 /DNA_ID=CAMNT_0049582237 /DNA_START=921 /DNA_END=1202 /DNA_ORIENTATION=-